MREYGHSVAGAMQRGDLLTAVLCAGLCLGVGAVSANEAPLADAGLDQDVQQGATVYLDAGGSLDPDGSIDSYRWQLTAPNGTSLRPDCPSCVQTEFRADQAGRYNVTVTVTDDSGASRSDTLFVDVNATAPPSVTLSGPVNATTNGTVTYEASVSAGDAPVSRLRWERNGTAVESVALDTTGTVVNRTVAFDSAGRESLGVTVTDRSGQTGRDNLSVNVRNTSDSTSSLGTVGSSGGSGYYKEIERFSTNDGVMFTFNFLNDDQIASNKGTGNALGSDVGGMGVKKSTLQTLSENNPDVKMTDGSYSETTYQISGGVAQNFIDNEDTTYSGTRVGTTDMITKSELTGSDTGAGSESQSDVTDQSNNGGLSDTSNNGDTSGDVSSPPTYSYDSDENQMEDSDGNCVGWGCGSARESSGSTNKGGDSSNSVGSSGSNSRSDSGGSTNSNTSGNSRGSSNCGPGEVWYESLGCW